MTFRLWIHTDNAAFDDGIETNFARNHETARILRRVAHRLEAGEEFDFYETLRDISGNDVGRAKFTRYPDDN